MTTILFKGLGVRGQQLVVRDSSKPQRKPLEWQFQGLSCFNCKNSLLLLKLYHLNSLCQLQRTISPLCYNVDVARPYTELVGGVSMQKFTNFLMAVMASVVSYYLCKWLDTIISLMSRGLSCCSCHYDIKTSQFLCSLYHDYSACQSEQLHHLFLCFL